MWTREHGWDIEHPDHEPCALGPPEAFSGEPAEPGAAAALRPWYGPDDTGENSPTIHDVLGRRTRGYKTRPTAAEVVRAVNAGEPDEAGAWAIRTWLIESSYEEKWWARLERAYSWRTLVEAMHRAPVNFYRQYRWINTQAVHPEKVDRESFPKCWRAARWR